MAYVKIGGVLLLLLGLLCGIHYYLARNICLCLQHFFPKVRLLYVVLSLSALSVLMFLSVARPFPGVFQRILSVIGTAWMALFVYLLLYFLAADLICLAVRLLPQVPQKLTLWVRLGAVALTLVTVIWGYLHANSIQTVHYDVKLTENPTAKMRVVMLSDLHLGAVNSENRLENIVSAVNAQKPDLVCIAGDIFDNDYSAIQNPDQVVKTLQKISATHGVYACLGNHDAGSEFREMVSFLDRAGIRLLEDKYAVINGGLILVGRRDGSPIGGNGGKSRQELSAVLAGADENLPVVIMDHNPANIGEYQGSKELVLSGHTHKGQIFPGNLITGAMYAVDYGYYKTKQGAQVIVTSGAGTWGLPVRVGTDCEIVCIDLAY